MNTQTLLKKAIQTHKLVSFEYEGQHRIGEPHVLGVSHDKIQVLIWQTEGRTTSHDDLPHWRRFNLSEIDKLTVLKEDFSARDMGKGAPFDSIIASTWDEDKKTH